MSVVGFDFVRLPSLQGRSAIQELQHAKSSMGGEWRGEYLFSDMAEAMVAQAVPHQEHTELHLHV